MRLVIDEPAVNDGGHLINPVGEQKGAVENRYRALLFRQISAVDKNGTAHRWSTPVWPSQSDSRGRVHGVGGADIECARNPRTKPSCPAPSGVPQPTRSIDVARDAKARGWGACLSR